MLSVINESAVKVFFRFKAHRLTENGHIGAERRTDHEKQLWFVESGLS
jgi:hypothetical protein